MSISFTMSKVNIIYKDILIFARTKLDDLINDYSLIYKNLYESLSSESDILRT